MKQFIILLASLILLIAYSFNSGGRAEIANSGNTGAPGETGLVCANCHLGGPYGPVTESMVLRDPVTNLESTSYQPGKLYTVEISISTGLAPSRYGFQATALGPDLSDAGIWMNPQGVVQIDTALVNGGTEARAYIEQDVPGFSPTFRSDWQAPPCDIGSITFYYIGNAVNNNSSTSGDVGGMGNSTTYSAEIPTSLVIDSSAVPSGYYIALDSIQISGNILSSNHVILGSNLGASLDSLQVNSNGLLDIFLETCLE